MALQKITWFKRDNLGRKRQSDILIEVKDGRIFFVKSDFAFKDPIKAMRGSKWHGYDDENPRKIWSADDCHRNWQTIRYLGGENIYAHFDQPLREWEYERPLMPHQKDMSNAGLTYHYQIFGAEMGVGKSLSAQEVIEKSGEPVWWWVGPKSSIPNIKREMRIWKFPFDKIEVEFLTYEGVVRKMDDWKPGDPLPNGVIFDESAKLKTWNAQRTQAASKLADLIRSTYGVEHGYVILMSGTPSPKSPVDWWAPCLSKDTWILTREGPRKIASLLGRETMLRVNNSEYRTQGFWNTGMRELFEVRTEEGYSVKATKNHRFRIVGGDWTAVEDLEAGDRLELANSEEFEWPGEGTFGDGYLLGLVVGDGHVYLKDLGLHASIPFWGRKRELIPVTKGYIPYPVEDAGITDDPRTLHTSYISKIVRKFEFDTTKSITEKFESAASSECVRGFLRGLFDTDGSVDYNRLRVTVSQVDRQRLLTTQRLLSYFGIHSKLQTNEKKNALPSYINGRKISPPDVTYILHVTGDDAVRFGRVIGFHHPDKRRLLAEKVAARHVFPDRRFATVLSITSCGQDEVFDATVEDSHSFSANGLLSHNCEIAWPGFLAEGSTKSFQERLAFTQAHTFDSGVTIKKLEGWRDDELKCKVCGELADHSNHNEKECEDPCDFHKWEKSINEVALLEKRLNGLAIIKHKKDCLNLPDKRYRRVYCKPSSSIVRVAQAITQSANNALTGATLLRELSDGFQYKEVREGTTKCNHCTNGKVFEWSDPANPQRTYRSIDILDDEIVASLVKTEVDCPACNGTCEVPKYVRKTQELPCPKDKALKELLEENEEQGRIVIFAGFTGSVDRCVRLCQEEGWDVVRCDGTAFDVRTHEGTLVADEEPLDYWANLEKHQRVAFVAHPESGGTSFTLTEARMAVYWSNTWKPDSRTQSEDRIHRIGADLNKGVLIVDLIHLPSDERVINVLRENRRLELLTMGEVMGDIDWENPKGVEGETVTEDVA